MDLSIVFDGFVLWRWFTFAVGAGTIVYAISLPFSTYEAEGYLSDAFTSLIFGTIPVSFLGVLFIGFSTIT